MSARKLAMAGALGLAAIGLIGAGAGATFTDSVNSTQKVTAGQLHMSLSAPGANCAAEDASGCHALTLPPVGPVGSTFESTPIVVTMKNTGDIPAFFDSIQMSATGGGDTPSTSLAQQLNVCIKSTDSSGTWVEGNGPLSVATALNPTVKENAVELQPGQSATYQVEFYAGKDSACGTTYSDGSHTAIAWAQQAGHAYQTPASLTNDAQGGSVTPKLTFAVTG